MKKMENISKDTLRELFCYLINGGATTLINYMVYLSLLHSKVNYLVANTAAWIVAVLFAYATNRIFVFHSQNQIGKEMLSFISLRFLTLLSENLMLFLFIGCLSFYPGISKVLVSVVTVIGNYFFCKCRIFRRPQNCPNIEKSKFDKGEIIHE